MYSNFLGHIKHFISGFCLSLSFVARSHSEFIGSHLGITFPTYILGKLLHILWDSAQTSISLINLLLLPHKGFLPLCSQSIFYILAMAVITSFFIFCLSVSPRKPEVHNPCCPLKSLQEIYKSIDAWAISQRFWLNWIETALGHQYIFSKAPQRFYCAALVENYCITYLYYLLHI